MVISKTKDFKIIAENKELITESYFSLSAKNSKETLQTRGKTAEIEQLITPPRKSTVPSRDFSVSPRRNQVKDLTGFGAVLWEKLQAHIDVKFDSLRASMGYDIRRNITELSNSLMSANLTPAGPNLLSSKSKLSIKVPIITLAEFLNYDDMLKTNDEEAKALVRFFKLVIIDLLFICAYFYFSFLFRNYSLEY